MTGLCDDDMVSSVETLREMARRLGATIQVKDNFQLSHIEPNSSNFIDLVCYRYYEIVWL